MALPACFTVRWSHSALNLKHRKPDPLIATEAGYLTLMNRRHFLAGTTVALSSLSGCLLPSEPEDCDEKYPVNGFIIRNRDQEPRTVDVTVIFDLIIYTDIPHEESYELGPVSEASSEGNRVSVSNVPNLAGNHVLRIRVGDSQTDYLWSVQPGQSCDALMITIQNGQATVETISQGDNIPPGGM